MKNYEDRLVQELSKSKVTMQADGFQLRIKAMPDETRPGFLDPRELQMMVEAQAAGTAGFKPGMSLQEMREMMGFPNRNLNTVEIHTAYHEIELGGKLVKFWVYWPRKPEHKTKRPCLIYLHGGGWVGGSVFTVENPCRLIAELADAVVVNVDYGLAPEKPYPQGLNDCYAVLLHIHDHAEDFGVDRDRIAMAGDSAGGNLVAACAIKDRDEGQGRIKLQVLLYPALTLAKQTKDYAFDLNAYEISAEHQAFLLPMVSAMAGEGISPVTMMYLGGNEALTKDPLVSPLWAEHFEGLPKALIVTPEFDGLRLQAEAYAKALQAAGVPVDFIRYQGQLHAFFDKLGILPQAEDLAIEISRALIDI